MKDSEKTAIMLSCLKDQFSTWGRERTNIMFPELRLGSGYCGVSQRRIDLFVISSNAGNETTAYEIKASRADFKKDVTDELKQRGARLYANNFYYVAPLGMLKKEEIPLWAGLLEFDFEYYDKEKNQYRFIESVPAPLHAKAMPSWGLICAMVRHINKDLGNDPFTVNNLKQDLRKEKKKVEDKDKLLKRVAAKFKKEYDEMVYWSLMNYRDE